MNKAFWKATLVRCVRTFLVTILAVFTGGSLITEVDWKAALLSAASATLYIFIVCIIAGLPEVPDIYMPGESDMMGRGEDNGVQADEKADSEL